MEGKHLVTITLELDQDVEHEAESRGLLASEKIVQMMTAALREQKRREAIQQTRTLLAQLDALEPKFTEEEIAEEMRKPSLKS